ncbi:GRIP and coiled-coil domain-containing protein 1 isoform X1 [Phymastichus coffea]|uniref:GRIP and coiled-coil domain-containing protein 1 isoform X1 n=1 Tax=Phymastichus coffea TaxID=108790 RepID=UPI00273CA3DA|nr:GRIP and coiled-coil domain-containing protein 1 isoform X1 [Phymastichus coffea]
MEKITKNKKEKRPNMKPDLENNLQDVKANEQSTCIEKEELNIQPSSVLSKESNSNEDSVEVLKNQLETLMNSLAVLSAEKSRMEASFQNEKKQIRSERDECERVIKTMKEKMKRIQGHAMSEVEHLKYKLIMERHEREKEQTEHSTQTKELQKMVHNEQKSREHLESQLKELKNIVPSKSQRALEAELDFLKNKLKQAQVAANETPTVLMNLQTEMTFMKKKYKNAIHEEQKRAAAAEQEAKTLAASHESRVVGLEARLAELSDIVGGYDRLRQQDQKAILKLKDQLINLQNNKMSENNGSPQQLAETIKSLYLQLVESDKSSSGANVKELLNNLKLYDKNQDCMYKEKYEAVISELEELKKRSTVIETVTQSKEKNSSSDDTQLHRARFHNKNLEEKLKMLATEISDKEKTFKAKLEQQQQQIQDQYLKTEHLLAQKDSEYLNKIAALEQQLLRQRERSLSVIQEKDKEIQMLKSSFDALLTKRNFVGVPIKQAVGVSDLVSGLLTIENNPPMIYYTQELARKEVDLSALRKQNVHLETKLRELERNSFRTAEKHEEEVKKYENLVRRLEASKSRENANLEYLKNVFINYLTSYDPASKRHMLNAISTVLQFTAEENEKVAKFK